MHLVKINGATFHYTPGDTVIIVVPKWTGEEPDTVEIRIATLCEFIAEHVIKPEKIRKLEEESWPSLLNIDRFS